MRICFVCQSGVLEPKAILLAASLRLYFPENVELIAAHPALTGPLQTETLKALAALDVGKIPVRNPLRPDYPIGHKFAALMLLDGPDCGIFIDTDVLVMTAPQSLPDSLAAVPASFNHHAKPVWEHVYNRFGLTLPLASPPTLVSRDRTAPYFNSGVIVVPGPVAKRLAASWIDTAMQIDGDPQVPDRCKRPNLSPTRPPCCGSSRGPRN